MNAPTFLVRVVRCYCEQCGYALSAMSIGALIDAQREHEHYVRWLAAVPIPPSLP